LEIEKRPWLYQKEKEKSLESKRNQYGSVGTRPITFNQKIVDWNSFPDITPLARGHRTGTGNGAIPGPMS
jgi:hypothetical protein